MAAGSANIGKFSDVEGDYTLIEVGSGSTNADAKQYSDSYDAGTDFTPDAPTRADETLLLYFTSGTTSRAKLVEHTHTSYPVGHLSTMYWIGLEPGDVHLNVASPPGWAKHAWSNVFTPWIAELPSSFTTTNASTLRPSWNRWAAKASRVSAPPHPLSGACSSSRPHPTHHPRHSRWSLPANHSTPKLSARWRKPGGVTIRDGFGQTESTVQIANTPAQPVKIGSMGRPLPGYDVVLVDPLTGQESDDGELCLRLDPPVPWDS